MLQRQLCKQFHILIRPQSTWCLFWQVALSHMIPDPSLAGRVTQTTPHFLFWQVALSQMTSEEELARGSVFPSVNSIRNVSLQVAIACARTAYENGLARASPGRGTLTFRAMDGLSSQSQAREDLRLFRVTSSLTPSPLTAHVVPSRSYTSFLMQVLRG